MPSSREIDFTIDPWPGKAEVLQRVSADAIQALDNLHRVAVDPTLKGEIVHQPAVIVPADDRRKTATHLMIGDILTKSLDPRLAGAIVLRAHGVDPWDAVQLLMHHYPGMHISTNDRRNKDRETAPRLEEAFDLAICRIFRDNPRNRGATIVKAVDASYHLQKARQHDDPIFADTVYRSRRRSSSKPTPKMIALGGLYVIKRHTTPAAETLVDWGEYADVRVASLSMAQALRNIRDSPHAPDMLLTYINDIGRSQGDINRPLVPWHEAAAADYIKGLSFKNIADLYGMSKSTVVFAIDNLISRYATSSHEDRPAYYLALVDAREARRRAPARRKA